MRSVLENLVRNAVEAMEEGGALTLETASFEGLQLGPDKAPMDYVKIEVLDTGRGIDPEQKAHLFEPGFSTGKEGTGLGLTIVRKIVEDHGGRVEVDTEPEVGTGVAIYLPTRS